MNGALARWRSGRPILWTLLVLPVALIGGVISFLLAGQPPTIDQCTVARLKSDAVINITSYPDFVWKSDQEVVILRNDRLRWPLAVRNIATGRTEPLTALQRLANQIQAKIEIFALSPHCERALWKDAKSDHIRVANLDGSQPRSWHIAPVYEAGWLLDGRHFYVATDEPTYRTAFRYLVCDSDHDGGFQVATDYPEARIAKLPSLHSYGYPGGPVVQVERDTAPWYVNPEPEWQSFTYKLPSNSQILAADIANGRSALILYRTYKSHLPKILRTMLPRRFFSDTYRLELWVTTDPASPLRCASLMDVGSDVKTLAQNIQLSWLPSGKRLCLIIGPDVRVVALDADGLGWP